MKKLFLLFLLAVNVQLSVRETGTVIDVESVAFAQHMYRESFDNCKINNLWYQVSDLCSGDDDLSPLRCVYCGLYFGTVSVKNEHQRTCKHRPHIEFKYDDAGNRVERIFENYHLGTKVVACYYCPTPCKDCDQSTPFVPVLWAARREDSFEVKTEKATMA